MSTRKPIPERSKLQRPRPVAYARRQKADDAKADDAKADDAKADAAKGSGTKPQPEPDTKTGIVTPDDLKRQIDKIPDAKPRTDGPAVTPEPTPDPKATTPASAGSEDTMAESRPDGADGADGANGADEPHDHMATVLAQAPILGEPPAMPATPATVDVSMGGVEDPTSMPGPREIPGGHPTDPAAAPGRVPPGDSRSFRRATEFALIYRVATFVISRFGLLGTRGQWRVVEYPTSAAASHAYAKEASRFVSDGFSDYRD